MKKAEVQIGKQYAARISGRLTVVRLDAESRFGGWNATNTATKRSVRIRSAAKLRREVGPARCGACANCAAVAVAKELARATLRVLAEKGIVVPAFGSAPEEIKIVSDSYEQTARSLPCREESA